MVFFWACEVTETKAAVVQIPENFVLNVCNATLASSSSEGIVSLGLETAQMDKKTWKGVVAHLGAAAHAHQVKLDLVVGESSAQIKFYIAKGTGKVNLTGYFQPGPPSDLFEDASQYEITPAATTTESSEPTKDASEKKKTKNNEKKRQRKEKTTWDQAASDSDADSDDAQEKKATAEPAKKQAKKEPSSSVAPSAAAAAAPQNGAASQSTENGKSSKKNRKNKKKNKDN